jgi:hypothetical protein
MRGEERAKAPQTPNRSPWKGGGLRRAKALLCYRERRYEEMNNPGAGVGHFFRFFVTSPSRA